MVTGSFIADSAAGVICRATVELSEPTAGRGDRATVGVSEPAVDGRGWTIVLLVVEARSTGLAAIASSIAWFKSAIEAKRSLGDFCKHFSTTASSCGDMCLQLGSDRKGCGG